MTHKKRILQINTSSDPGGGPVVMFDIVSSLCTEFDFVTLAPKGIYTDKYKALGIKTYDVPIRSLNPLVILKIISIIKREGIELVHTHGKGAGIWGRLAAILSGVKVVHTLHGIHYERMKYPWRNFYFLIERILSYGTNLMINVSESEKEEALKFKLYPSHKAKIIHNGVKIPEQFSVNRDNSRITSIGNISMVKNQTTLLTIAKHLPTPMHIDVIGYINDPALDLRIQNQIKNEGLESKIHFLGGKSQKEIMEYLKSSFIYLAVSSREALGLTLLEAGSVGVPTVASRVVGHIDIIDDRQSGLFFDLKNPAEAAEKIKELASNPSLYNLISSNIRTKVSDRFSFREMVDRYREVYKKT